MIHNPAWSGEIERTNIGADADLGRQFSHPQKNAAVATDNLPLDSNNRVRLGKFWNFTGQRLARQNGFSLIEIHDPCMPAVFGEPRVTATKPEQPVDLLSDRDSHRVGYRANDDRRIANIHYFAFIIASYVMKMLSCTT